MSEFCERWINVFRKWKTIRRFAECFAKCFENPLKIPKPTESFIVQFIFSIDSLLLRFGAGRRDAGGGEGGRLSEEECATLRTCSAAHSPLGTSASVSFNEWFLIHYVIDHDRHTFLPLLKRVLVVFSSRWRWHESFAGKHTFEVCHRRSSCSRRLSTSASSSTMERFPISAAGGLGAN